MPLFVSYRGGARGWGGAQGRGGVGRRGGAQACCREGSACTPPGTALAMIFANEALLMLLQ